MSILSQAVKPTPRAPILTIAGFPGTGKTTLGAMFPNPIFIRAEDGGAVFDNWEDKAPALLPVLPDPRGNSVSTKDTILEQLRALATEEHDYKTVVIDSITALNLKFEKEIIERENADPMSRRKISTVAEAAGGFHKGYDVLKDMHSEIMYAAMYLREKKNISVVFLSHVKHEKIKNDPSESSEYTVFALDMHRDSYPIYVNNSDGVLFIELEAFVQGGETNNRGQQIKQGRVNVTGNRVIITEGAGRIGYTSAKNRFDMPSPIPFTRESNPLLQYIKFYSN